MDAFFAKGGVVDPDRAAPDCPEADRMASGPGSYWQLFGSRWHPKRPHAGSTWS